MGQLSMHSGRLHNIVQPYIFSGAHDETAIVVVVDKLRLNY